MTHRVIFAMCLCSWQLCIAQDVLITDARIIDGLGNSIERGNVVITDGRIAAVTTDDVDKMNALVINANGMTVMPGMINTH